jgi:hypothetical protein
MNTSEAFELWIKREGHHVIALSRWKIQAKSKNGAKTFTTLLAMWLYRISNFES